MRHRVLGILVPLLVVFLSAAAAAQTKVVIGLPGSTDLHPQHLIDKFIEENPDIEVEAQRFAWADFFEKLPAMLATGTAPDVWYGESGRALGWRFQGITEDLSRYVERDINLDDYFFLDAAVDPRTGEWTGIPGDFQVNALFYNTSHLPARGVPFPDDSWTIDDFVENAKRLTVPGPECPARYGYVLSTGITSGWALWPRMLGAEILSPDRTESRLNTPETIAALDFMRSLLYDHGIAPAPGGGCSGYSFTNGGSSMEFAIFSRIIALKNAGMDEFEVAVTPKTDSGHRMTTAVPNVWVINNASSPETKEAAWRWIKFQIGEEAQVARMLGGAGVLMNKNVSHAFLAEPGPPSRRDVFLESFAFAQTLEENAVWQEYRGPLQSALSPLWTGRITAQEAALNAHQVVTAIFENTFN